MARWRTRAAALRVLVAILRTLPFNLRHTIFDDQLFFFRNMQRLVHVSTHLLYTSGMIATVDPLNRNKPVCALFCPPRRIILYNILYIK